MDWKSMPPSHKVATVIACIAVLFWLVSTIQPELLPIDLTYPAVAAVTVCEAVVYWENKRKWAYLLIAGAAISMACFILELLLL